MDLEKFPCSPAAQRMLSYVTKGWYDDSYVGKWVYETMGREVDGVEAFLAELPEQFFVSAATWGLRYHELKHGLAVREDLPYEERRILIMEKRDSRYPMNPYQMENVLHERFGAEVHVNDVNDPGKFRFSHPNSFSILFVQDGDGAAIDVKEAKRIVQKIKSSHTVFLLKYEHLAWVFFEKTHYGMGIVFTAPVIVRGKPRTLDGSWPLDGSCLLDATWRLGSYGAGHGCRMKVRQEAAFDAGIALGRGVRALARTTHQPGIVFTAPMVVRGTVRRLDGTWLLDGSCLLDNVWRLGVYGIGNGCRMGARQEVAFGASERHGSHVQANASAHGGMGMAAETPGRCHVGSPKMETTIGVSRQPNYGAMIEARKDLWRLDGTVKLDGSRRLDAEIHGLEL